MRATLFRLALRRRDRWERDVEDEIKLHLALRAEQLMAQGADADSAYDEAVRRFGPLTESRTRLLEAARHREERMQRTEFLDDLRLDASFAFRTLAKQKGWAAVTILTLALGIGATTAVFSVVSTLLLHPLPYPHGDRVVFVDQQPTSGNNTGIQVTIAPQSSVVRAWQAGSHSFEAIEGSGLGPRLLKTTSEPSRVSVAVVFPTFAAFAGERPVLGRWFTSTDVAAGGGVVVLGEAMWRERFGGSQGVLGKVITVGDSSYMIIGVMPEALRFPGVTRPHVDLWIPLDVRNNHLGMAVIGRLRPGATMDGAARELDSLFARSAGFTSGAAPFHAKISTPAQRVRFHDSLIMLTAAVGLVLLVACANVAHLVLARSATRQREMAIRAALGAGRGRLLRQLLTETLILALTGGALGVFAGWLGLRGLVALRPQSLDTLQFARLDATTLTLAVSVAILSAILFAIIGGVQSGRHSTHDALKSGSLTASVSRGRARGLLVVTEMALTATLIVGATMLVRSVINLQHTPLGFEPKGLYAVSAPLQMSHFETPASRAAFMAEYMRRVRDIPAVRSASVAGVSPGSRWFSIGRLEIQGQPAPPKTATSFNDVNLVQNSYFRTMGIPLVGGTLFTDTTALSREVIVNAGFAKKTWPDGDATGHRLRIAQSDSEPWLTIVGVAGDALLGGPLSESTVPMLYSPAADRETPSVLIRTDGDAKSLAPAMTLLTSMGVKRPPPIESVEHTVSQSIAAPRFIMLLLSVFTILALLLAGIGLYGVMTYTVAQETREIGIRVALGASRSRIGRSVLGRGVWLALAGGAVGVVGAVWSTKLIEHQLHGVARTDPVSFIVGVTVLIITALAACVVPTWRALAVDPMTAIRAE